MIHINFYTYSEAKLKIGVPIYQSLLIIPAEFYQKDTDENIGKQIGAEKCDRYTIFNYKK